MNDNDRRRRDTLLAGLNEAPSALIGWDVVDRKALRLRTGLVPAYRWRRLDGMWWALKGGAYAEKVRMDQAERYFAMTGRRLPDPRLRMKPPATTIDHMKALEDALREAARPVVVMLDSIAETLSKIVFPRIRPGQLSQDDMTKGA